jgi:hypothetical protein
MVMTNHRLLEGQFAHKHQPRLLQGGQTLMPLTVTAAYRQWLGHLPQRPTEAASSGGVVIVTKIVDFSCGSTLLQIVRWPAPIIELLALERLVAASLAVVSKTIVVTAVPDGAIRERQSPLNAG